QALYQKTMNPESMTLQLTYPIADLRGIKLHLERNFYGVQTTAQSNITNIDYVKLISMSFMAEMKTGADTERLGAWELTLFDFCYNYTANSDNKLEIQGQSRATRRISVKEGSIRPVGFSIMFAFVCITVSGSSLYFDRLRWSTFLVAVSCAIVPVLAITTTFGLCSLIGNRTNSLMLIMPFLIMGIGVNDSFLTTHAWLRQPLRQPAAVRLGKVLEEVKRYFRAILRGYSCVLADRRTALVLFLGTLVYWYFGIMGTIKITAKLDTEKILPKDTPIHRPNRLVENIVWAEYYPVTIIVNNPVDVRDVDRLNEVNAFVAEFEQLPTCRVNDFDFYFDADEYPDEKEFGFKKLAGFLGNPLYKHHKAFLNLDYNQTVSVRKFSLVVVYENNTSWDDRIDLMLKWRAIVDRYPSLNASVWNVNAMFVDQMLSLKSLTWQTCLWTLFCMAIVCAIFIQNPISVIMATTAIASISLGVMGYLSFWHLDLDPVSLCAVLISIGMAVDFVAHTTYHYQLSYREVIRKGQEIRVELDTPYSRIRHTISNIAWPMSQAGISTVICILPIVVLQNYIPLVFVKTITLVVIWGLWHGLVLLPAFLSQIPLRVLNFNCYRVLVNARNEVAGQEMLLLDGDAIRT
ncbi:patched family protein, partial [Teladorsagia circumcincta]